jgi:organic hydroperoxide reductase OsmC/OhrA
VAIDAEVDLGTTPGLYGLAARLTVSLPGIERHAAQVLVGATRQVCPYSHPTCRTIDAGHQRGPTASRRSETPTHPYSWPVNAASRVD